MNFSPFPIINTERLQLRQLAFKDGNEILFLRSDKRILEFIDIPKTEYLQHALDYIKKMNNGITNNEFILWGITNKPIDSIIGTICLWNFNYEKDEAEIGYVLHPEKQGLGLMQEAVKEVLHYGFNIIKVKTIIAKVHPENKKSVMLLKHYNFLYAHEKENLAEYVLHAK